MASAFVAELARRLQGKGAALAFGLLTDFSDAQAETSAGDAALLSQAEEAIQDLNRRYAAEAGGGFFLFHRSRRWNPSEKIWLGHERNRGKLADLNHLLQGASNHDFQSIIGDRTQLRAGRYVITLDTDTQLPRDSARQLVGIMAHPLNQARYDEKTGRVTEGYGILQPRMLTRYAGARQSWYALLNNNEPGIDPYT